MGEPERGKTLFEGIVDSHPKRWDLWTIYIDMEVGQNDIQSMRLAIDIVLWHCLPSLSLLSLQKHIRSCACSKNDKPQSQVRSVQPTMGLFTYSNLCTALLGLSSRNGLHWRNGSGMRQVLRRSKQRLLNGLGAPQYTQQKMRRNGQCRPCTGHFIQEVARMLSVLLQYISNITHRGKQVEKLGE